MKRVRVQITVDVPVVPMPDMTEADCTETAVGALLTVVRPMGTIQDTVVMGLVAE